jgi:hypothetical protein
MWAHAWQDEQWVQKFNGKSEGKRPFWNTVDSLKHELE